MQHLSERNQSKHHIKTSLRVCLFVCVCVLVCVCVCVCVCERVRVSSYYKRKNPGISSPRGADALNIFIPTAVTTTTTATATLQVCFAVTEHMPTWYMGGTKRKLINCEGTQRIQLFVRVEKYSALSLAGASRSRPACLQYHMYVYKGRLEWGKKGHGTPTATIENLSHAKTLARAHQHSTYANMRNTSHRLQP